MMLAVNQSLPPKIFQSLFLNFFSVPVTVYNLLKWLCGIRISKFDF